MRGPNGRWISLAIFAGATAAAAAWLDVRVRLDITGLRCRRAPVLRGAAAGPNSPSFPARPDSLAPGDRIDSARGRPPGGALVEPAQRAWFAIFGIGYAIRAVVWICGGNLPLVPGDSCHYLEVATSVLRGEGPVKHYVESFFRDYPRIRDGQGVLDDWATPLDAYVRALAFRIAGLGRNASLDARIVAAKGCSFILNLLALPALYVFARRRYGPAIALWSMAALAVLPVHAIYAGFILRESLVALMSILAVWTLTEVWHAARAGPSIWAWAVTAGLCGGLAVLARTTGLALLAAAGLYALVAHGRQRPGALVLWAGVAALVCLPWAWITFQEYAIAFLFLH